MRTDVSLFPEVNEPKHTVVLSGADIVAVYTALLAYSQKIQQHPNPDDLDGDVMDLVHISRLQKMFDPVGFLPSLDDENAEPEEIARR